MERSVGSKKSIYGMLMTVLFYTTGSICALRTAAWLAMHTLIPAISHIIALYYRPSSSSFSNPAPPSPVASGAGLVSNAGAEDIAGLLFKLVHTAAGHDLLVPVPASMYRISGAAAESTLRRAVARLALLSSLIGAGGIAAYYYSLRRPSAWTWGKSISVVLQRRRHGPSSPGTRTASDTDSSSTTESRCSKTRLNPTAPAFTPSSSSSSPSSSPAPLVPSPPELHRLDPTARTFAPRGCATPPSPADSTDSVGPAMPSPSCIPSAFALAAARVARAAGTGMGKSVSAGMRLPVGVGKMRVVRPEEVVAGERRAGEVFVFF